MRLLEKLVEVKPPKPHVTPPRIDRPDTKGKTIVDEPEVIEYARRHRLTLVAVTEQAVQARTSAA